MPPDANSSNPTINFRQEKRSNQNSSIGDRSVRAAIQKEQVSRADKQAGAQPPRSQREIAGVQGCGAERRAGSRLQPTVSAQASALEGLTQGITLGVL